MAYPVNMLKIACVIGATFCIVQSMVSASPAPARWKRENPPENHVFQWSENERFPFIFPAAGDKWPGSSNHFLRCFLTTFETFAIADNTHWDIYFMPKKLETDRRHHVVAASWAQLLDDLRTIETAHRIYRGLAENVVLRRSNYTDKEQVRELIINMDFEEMADSWFAGLDKALARDPLAGRRYEEAKRTHEALVVLEPDHLQKEIESSSRLATLFAKRESETRVKQLRVHLIFAGLLRTNDDDDDDKDEVDSKKSEFRAMARTVLEMSKKDDEYYAKLQRIYRESVAEAAKHVLHSLKEVGGEASALYTNLKEKINADPTISAEFEEKKKDILKKLNKKA